MGRWTRHDWIGQALLLLGVIAAVWTWNHVSLIGGIIVIVVYALALRVALRLLRW